MLAVIDHVRAAIALDLLVVGAREAADVFRVMTGAGRPFDQVFLWYNLLSDIDGMEESDLVVSWRGERSRGWGGWAEKGAEVNETFRFVCPNNPAAREKTLRRLGEMLGRYQFTGVFLDKLRFPLPANGFDEVVSCFCGDCRRAARAIDLDLDAVARLFADRVIVIDTPAVARHGDRSDRPGCKPLPPPIPCSAAFCASGRTASQNSSPKRRPRPRALAARSRSTCSRRGWRNSSARITALSRVIAAGRNR